MIKFNPENELPIVVAEQVAAKVPKEELAAILKIHFQRMGKDIARYNVMRSSDGEAQTFIASSGGVPLQVKTVFRVGMTMVSLEDEA